MIEERRLKIVFMGMNTVFSQAPLQTLLQQGVRPGALVMPHPAGAKARARKLLVPQGAQQSIFQLVDGKPGLYQLAVEYDIPIIETGSLQGVDAFNMVASLQPDIIVVACFPFLLPHAWLELPEMGCVNLHPSLLPAYRGPAPLFWQFLLNESRMGVTLHLLDQGIDSGPVLAQREVLLPTGMTTNEADRVLGLAGGEMLTAFLTTPTKYPRQDQNADEASYHPYPEEADKQITTDWAAERAYRFMCGAEDWMPFEVIGPDRRWQVLRALELHMDMNVEKTPAPQPGMEWIIFQGGAVRVEVANSG